MLGMLRRVGIPAAFLLLETSQSSTETYIPKPIYQLGKRVSIGLVINSDANCFDWEQTILAAREKLNFNMDVDIPPECSALAPKLHITECSKNLSRPCETIIVKEQIRSGNLYSTVESTIRPVKGHLADFAGHRDLSDSREPCPLGPGNQQQSILDCQDFVDKRIAAVLMYHTADEHASIAPVSLSGSSRKQASK